MHSIFFETKYIISKDAFAVLYPLRNLEQFVRLCQGFPANRLADTRIGEIN